jgi:putative hydrolase of the HAD superfamily
MNHALPITAVIFDLGRVLVNVDTQRLWTFFFEQVEPKDTQRALAQIMADPMMVQYSIGQLDSKAFHRQLCDNYGLTLSFAQFASRWCDIFSPIPGMDEIVKSLGGKVRLGLLSDTDPLHWNYIKANYPLMNCFAKPTLSFEIGAMKPSRESYLAAAKNTNTEVSRCLFIDDLQNNVDGAVAAGMRAIRFENVEQLRGHFQIRQFLIDNAKNSIKEQYIT